LLRKSAAIYPLSHTLHGMYRDITTVITPNYMLRTQTQTLSNNGNKITEVSKVHPLRLPAEEIRLSEVKNCYQYAVQYKHESSPALWLRDLEKFQKYNNQAASLY
jgi:hypothetical protein